MENKKTKRVGLVLSEQDFELFQETRFAGRYRSVGEMIRQAVNALAQRQKEDRERT